MFTDISKALSSKGVDCVLVDLNVVDADGNILLSNLSEQVAILRKTHEAVTEGVVDVIGHSLGCLAAAMADLPHIRRTILLAPPTVSDSSKMIDYFRRNPLTHIDTEGVSRLARRDGTFTIVPREYWQEKESLNLENIFQSYIAHNDVYIVKASLDEITSNDGLERIFKGAHFRELEANHDFKDEARPMLISLCEELIQGVDM